MDDDSLVTAQMRQALAHVTAAMERFGASYALIGGIATSFRSQPRFTKDVDFLVEVTQHSLPPLLESLKERGFEFDIGVTIKAWNEHHMAMLQYRGLPIDWLKPILPLYVHVLARATEEDWLDQRIRIASVEGLILTKLLAFRAQDQIDIESLVAARRDTLDLDWIEEEWKSVADLDDPRMMQLLKLTGKR